MRSALIWAFLLLCSLGYSADILILVHQREAGPIVPPSDYEHPTWTLWPHSSLPSQGNRLLSLPSGVDWQTQEADEKFEGLTNSNVNRWLERGWEKAVKSNLGEPKLFALAPESGEPSQWVLQAAMSSPTQIQTIRMRDAWPPNALIVAEARGRNPWDDVARFVHKAGGRALVVEVPDSSTTMWTRFWLQGKSWPEGKPVLNNVRITGLIPARNLMALLAEPARAAWSAERVVPPDRWLGFGHSVAPVVLVFLAVTAIYILGLGIYCSLREQFSRISLVLVRGLVAGPAALLLGGELTGRLGPQAWAACHVLAFVAIVISAWLINRTITWRKREFHPLWGEFAIGAVVSGACDPVWSMFSNVLGPHRAPTSPEAFGALAAYLIGAVILLPRRKRLKEFWIAFVSIATISLFMFAPWLQSLAIAPAVLIVVIADEISSRPHDPPKKRLPILPFVLVIALVCALWNPGLAYAPQGLVYTFAQFGKFNCAEQIAFLLSPTFIAFCLVCIVAAIIGENFLGHQARRAMAFSPMPKAFFPVALCFLVAGVFIPLYLYAFLATALAGVVAVLFDAIRIP